MKAHTVFLGRLLGLYTLVTVVWMMTRKPVAIALITEMVGDRPLMLLLAIFALAAGLALVLGHNIWSGGALPILVTLTGWIVLLRSLLLLALSSEGMLPMLEAIQFAEFFYVYLAIPLALGLALTYWGFTASTPTGVGS